MWWYTLVNTVVTQWSHSGENGTGRNAVNVQSQDFVFRGREFLEEILYLIVSLDRVSVVNNDSVWSEKLEELLKTKIQNNTNESNHVKRFSRHLVKAQSRNP